MPLPQSIQTFIDRQADAAPERYDDLRAVIFNGTLKRSPEPSNTDGMLAIVRGILRRLEVTVDEIRRSTTISRPAWRPICASMAATATSFRRSTGIW